jgi:hypothetical protein
MKTSMAKGMKADLELYREYTLEGFAASTNRAADVVMTALRLDTKLVEEARRRVLQGTIKLSNAVELTKLEPADQRAYILDATEMKADDFESKMRVLKKQMKADRAEKTVLVVIVDELGTSEFVKLELLGSELERVLGMHGTVVSVGSDEMSTREQLVYDYFFTPKGKHRHKSSKKRADGPFDHAILVYYNRS